MFLQVKRSLIVKSLIVTVITTLLMTSLNIPTATFASDLKLNSHQKSEPYTIVALGDSITAGYEPDRITGVDSYGFVERLEEQGWFYNETKAVNLGIVGLTSTGLLRYVTALETGQVVTGDFIQAGIMDTRIDHFAKSTPTAREQLVHADVITITIGGNDLLQVIAGLKLSNVTQFKTQVNEAIAMYKKNLASTLEIIYKMNPDATIIIADQYQPIPKKMVGGLYTYLQESMNRFTRSLDLVAGEFNKNGRSVQVVHLAELFRNKESTYTHIESDIDIHPNQAGYELIASVMSTLIWGQYRDTAAMRGEAKLSIILRGNELKLKEAMQPITAYGEVYIPVAEAMERMGGMVGWTNATKSLNIQFQENVLLQVATKLWDQGNSNLDPYSAGWDNTNWDGKTNNTPPALLINNNYRAKTYISLNWMVEQFALKMKYSEQMKSIFLY